MHWVDEYLKTQQNTYTQLGTVSYLLFGRKPSTQSINIKMGRLGEFLAKEMVKSHPSLILLNCGVYDFNTHPIATTTSFDESLKPVSKKKDVDLLFQCEDTKTIYYRELKGNIELDTEKFPATIEKCLFIKKQLQSMYANYSINCGIFHWTMYSSSVLPHSKRMYKETLQENEIEITSMKDYLSIVEMNWDEKDYYIFFRKIGNRIINEE